MRVVNLPTGWSKSSLSSLGDCIRGVTYNPKIHLKTQDSDGTVRLLRSNNVQNGVLNTEAIQFVSRGCVSMGQQMVDGDILLCMANGSRALVGKAAKFSNSAQYTYTFGAFMGVFRPSNKEDSDYILFLTQSKSFRDFLDIALSGSSINNLRPSQILEMSFAFPGVEERRLIANTLRDIDDLVGSLDNLIAKKRAIKQGVMQQLLTGQTRLPGFRGEWTISRLGDIGTFRGGTGFPLHFQGSSHGEVPFFKVSDMNLQGNAGSMHFWNHSVESNQLGLLGATPFDAGTIIFAKVGAAVFLERKRLLVRPSCLDNNMAGFSLNSSFNDPHFFFYWFQGFRLSDLVAATALPSINNSQLNQIEASYPKLEEQLAITEILSDIDKEIDSLLARRNKTALIKIGMMQDLLTGKVRL